MNRFSIYTLCICLILHFSIVESKRDDLSVEISDFLVDYVSFLKERATIFLIDADEYGK